LSRSDTEHKARHNQHGITV